ncbi:MAG: class I tRNA ligase family protein, partial [Lautropia sp.]|nr:class I tRNA ligase family protein [Lautropia sp.]
TTRIDSRERRSAQTALWHITGALLKLMAPILSFTADEAWEIFAPEVFRREGGTIQTQVFQGFDQIAGSAELDARWTRIREARANVLKELETLRERGDIGSSLQAEVIVKAGGERFAALQSLEDDLRFVMITSAATVEVAANAQAESIEVRPSPHPKCARCWHWRRDVGADPQHPAICGRCVSNLFGDGEPRSHA